MEALGEFEFAYTPIKTEKGTVKLSGHVVVNHAGWEPIIAASDKDSTPELLVVEMKLQCEPGKSYQSGLFKKRFQKEVPIVGTESEILLRYEVQRISEHIKPLE